MRKGNWRDTQTQSGPAVKDPQTFNHLFREKLKKKKNLSCNNQTEGTFNNVNPN